MKTIIRGRQIIYFIKKKRDLPPREARAVSEKGRADTETHTFPKTFHAEVGGGSQAGGRAWAHVCCTVGTSVSLQQHSGIHQRHAASPTRASLYTSPTRLPTTQ